MQAVKEAKDEALFDRTDSKDLSLTTRSSNRTRLTGRSLKRESGGKKGGGNGGSKREKEEGEETAVRMGEGASDKGLTGGRDSEAEEERGSSKRKKVRLALGGGGVKDREEGENWAVCGEAGASKRRSESGANEGLQGVEEQE